MGLEVCVLRIESPDSGGVVRAPSVLPGVGPMPCRSARIHGTEVRPRPPLMPLARLQGCSRTLAQAEVSSPPTSAVAQQVHLGGVESGLPTESEAEDGYRHPHKAPGDHSGAVRQGSRPHQPRSHSAEGLLFHASGPIDGGWGIFDFWESREDFDAFSVRITEGMAAAGVQPQGPPDIKEFPVHEMIHP